MMRLFVDKENKIPLYLQLKEQIKYYISIGVVGAPEQLPPVKILARDLRINFQTVRKAYRELESEGLVEIRHGEGTFISLSDAVIVRRGKRSDAYKRNGAFSHTTNLRAGFADAMMSLLEKYLKEGLEFAEARRIIEGTIKKIERGDASPRIVFSECNEYQIKQISKLLEDELKLEVIPMLVENLKSDLLPLIEEGRRSCVITTGFHVNEVRRAVGEMPVQIEVLITNLNPETRRRLEIIGEKGKYSFICRDRESAVLYRDLLKAELGYKQIHLTACTLSETEKVRKILASSNTVLVSPPVYEEVRRLTSPRKAIYNLFERVDPMSLKVVKDRILGDGKSIPSRS
jgi:DNA-binding transcriptional regulator YhcF (GntR family)